MECMRRRSLCDEGKRIRDRQKGSLRNDDFGVTSGTINNNNNDDIKLIIVLVEYSNVLNKHNNLWMKLTDIQL